MSNGKGDKNRVKNLESFRKNYDKIYGDSKEFEELFKQEQDLSVQRQSKKIKIIKEYTDNNNRKK